MEFRVKVRRAPRGENGLDGTTLEGWAPAKLNHKDPERVWPLRAIYNAAAEDPRGPLSKVAKRQDIPLEVMETGLAYMIAKMPWLYERIAGPPGTKKKILIDENLPPALAIRLWRDFGAATHSKFEGTATLKDSELWDWAIQKKIDVIVTRDSRLVKEGVDLGMIALRHTFDRFHGLGGHNEQHRVNGAPIVLSFGAQSDKPIWEWMRSNQRDIHAGLHQGKSPILYVNQNGVFGKPTCRALARNDWDTVKAMITAP